MSKQQLSLSPSPYKKDKSGSTAANFLSLLFGISFLISIPLIFCTLTLYWNTLINGYRLLLLAIGIGFSITILFRNRIDFSSEKYDLPFGVRLILFCVCNSFSLGTILIFSILWSNQAFGGRSQTTIKLPVASFGYTRGHRNSDPVPYVDVVYKEKKLGKYYPRYADVEHIDSLRVRVTDGWLGYEVVQIE